MLYLRIESEIHISVSISLYLYKFFNSVKIRFVYRCFIRSILYRKVSLLLKTSKC